MPGRPHDAILRLSLPLQTAMDLNPLLQRIGQAPYVLLGEASHGTAEYYEWRKRLSQRLILEEGFNFIAVEGDWPDCYRINRYIKGRANAGRSAREVVASQFRRWPTWMWGNEEVIGLVDWLRRHNEALPEERKVGFYGLDVYSLWESIEVLSQHLRTGDPVSRMALDHVIQCFEPYGGDAQSYAWATADHAVACSEEINALLGRLQKREGQTCEPDDQEAHFQAEQNAVVLKNAEAYYRAMVRRGPESWNIRDRHMTDTLDRLMGHHGAHAKAIIWEHNTHIGDARFTDMTNGGMLNVGQLVRERHGNDAAVLVGFSSYQGTVIAGESWDAPMEVMPVPPAQAGSWEHLLHEVQPSDKLLIFDPQRSHETLHERRGHRAIGVVYQPEFEQFGNYMPTILPLRYDALLHIDRTTALHPLAIAARQEKDLPETYPSAF